MKLSEAIRLGSMLRPQVFGDLFRDGGSCAVGAAYEAVGVTPADNVRSDVLAPWAARWNRLKPGRCPECHMQVYDSLIQTAGHLNDDHRWTRERIADWVQALEPAETTDAAPQLVAVFAAPNRWNNPT